MHLHDTVLILKPDLNFMRLVHSFTQHFGRLKTQNVGKFRHALFRKQYRYHLCVNYEKSYLWKLWHMQIMCSVYSYVPDASCILQLTPPTTGLAFKYMVFSCFRGSMWMGIVFIILLAAHENFQKCKGKKYVFSTFNVFLRKILCLKHSVANKQAHFQMHTM